MMISHLLTVRRFLIEEEGVTAIEYGLLAALIAVVLIAGAGLTGANLNTMFSNIANCLSSPSISCFSSPP